MRRAQVSIFLIAGAALLIGVVFLLLVARSAGPQAPVARVQEDVSKANTCLARTTRLALEGLRESGSLTVDAGGPFSAPHRYIEANPNRNDPENTVQVMGKYNYLGLCESTGVNGIGKVFGKRYPCPPATYNRNAVMSVQKQLEYAITNQMQTCIDGAGSAEVFIQSDAVVVRWDSPEIQHREPTSLPLAWTAMEEIARREVSDKTFNPDVDALRCVGCERVTVERRPEHHTFDILVDGQHTAAMTSQERGIAFLEDIDDLPALVQRDEITDDRCDGGCELFTVDDVTDVGARRDGPGIDGNCGYDFPDTDEDFVGPMDCSPEPDVVNVLTSTERYHLKRLQFSNYCTPDGMTQDPFDVILTGSDGYDTIVRDVSSPEENPPARFTSDPGGPDERNHTNAECIML